MRTVKPWRTGLLVIATSLVAAFWAPLPASAFGESDTRGEAEGKQIAASVSQSGIKVTQIGGPTGGKRGTLASVDVNWKPPPCWYEPAFTPAQLKTFAETNGEGNVSIRQGWQGTSTTASDLEVVIGSARVVARGGGGRAGGRRAGCSG